MKKAKVAKIPPPETFIQFFIYNLSRVHTFDIVVL